MICRRFQILPGLALVLAATSASAQQPSMTVTQIPAPTEAGAIPLWPAGSLPPSAVPESWTQVSVDFPDGTHVENRAVRNVTIPTITPILPDPAKATGAAVIVAPGGAFKLLSIDSEGYATARWLADHGIAAFVLKYRVNTTPADDELFKVEFGELMEEAVQRGGAVARVGEPRAYQDGLRALAMVREGASRWNVDPARVGMIGFSAGAITALQTVITGSAEQRPAFIGYIYGPMASVDVPSAAPPMFAAFALDDKLFGQPGFGIVSAWQKAAAPVELHAYQKGDHGFGTGRPGTTTMLVMEEFRLWMETNGWLEPAGKH